VPNRPPRLERVLQRYDPPMYFVTFNTHSRRHLLANEHVHQRFVAFGKAGLARGIAIGRYVIMPDHRHLFARGSLDFVLVQSMRILKRSLSRAIHEAAPRWQSGFVDHLIRHSESYAEKWEYVRLNPVRAGLVKNCQELTWQGEIEWLEA
jgi:REP-associated tyrosine transposase